MPKVAFGNEELFFELEPGDVLTEAQPTDGGPGWDIEKFRLRLEAIEFDRVLNLGKVLFVVNDAFRPTPTGPVLAQLKKFYPELQADFIVACGNHPAPSESDIQSIFAGYELDGEARIFSHNSRDMDSMIEIGKFEDYPVYVNRTLFDYPAVITIGSVEPHYFAGYTGGRKSLIPGLSDIETNRRNHAMAVSQDAQPLKLRGNPVAENLDELLALVKLPCLYSIQMVTGRQQKILDAFAGSIKDAFDQAVAVADDIYVYRASSLFDLVIAEMRPPLDRNFYQLQKAVENCASVVADEGTIVAVSRCREGIGNDEFYNLAITLDDEEMVLSRAELDNPPLGIHKLSRIIMLSKRIQVKALTGLKQEILEQVFWEPAVSLEAEMRKLRSNNDHLKILLVRDAGLLVAKLDV